MTSLGLKIIAIITMLCDHISDGFFHHFTFLNVIGRISFPIFAFLIAEGYQHTSNVKKYLKRLLLFALISQIPFTLFYTTFSNNLFVLNIFFTLSAGLFAIYLYDKCQDKLSGLLGVISIAVLAELLHFDYGGFGVLIIFVFYVLRNKKIWMTLSFLFLCFLKYLPSFITYSFHPLYILLTIFTTLPILFILLYNGKQGKKGKKLQYFFYLFYPLHLLFIFVISHFFLN